MVYGSIKVLIKHVPVHVHVRGTSTKFSRLHSLFAVARLPGVAQQHADVRHGPRSVRRRREGKHHWNGETPLQILAITTSILQLSSNRALQIYM